MISEWHDVWKPVEAASGTGECPDSDRLGNDAIAQPFPVEFIARRDASPAANGIDQPVALGDTRMYITRTTGRSHGGECYTFPFVNPRWLLVLPVAEALSYRGFGIVPTCRQGSPLD